LNRRSFLKQALGLAGSLASLGVSRFGASAGLALAGSKPRVIIVGAGLAGLTAAYRLSHTYGIHTKVFEARHRLGGRVLTRRGLPNGQWFEGGPAFISSRDQSIRQLARELSVGLIDIWEPSARKMTVCRFNNRTFSATELQPSLDRTSAVARSQFERMTRDPKLRMHWDSLSVAEWISTFSPGGSSSAVGKYLTNYFEAEYSAPVELASALAIILDRSDYYEGFDERYIIAGGTDTIVNALASRLPPGTITTGMALTALKPGRGDSVDCTFAHGATTADMPADLVILALPFSTLREVNYSAMGFSRTKNEAIRQKGMGVGSKLNMQFDGVPWRPSYNGDSYSDLPPQSTFEAQRSLPGNRGILAELTTITFAGQPAHGPASAALVTEHLGYLDLIFSKVAAAFDGLAVLDHWPADPWAKGSYSYFGVGQFTKFAGIEKQPEGRIHFAGEHTASYRSQATMNGAVESGERAATEVADAIRNRWKGKPLRQRLEKADSTTAKLR